MEDYRKTYFQYGNSNLYNGSNYLSRGSSEGMNKPVSASAPASYQKLKQYETC